jgi:hypothetical protein
MVALQWKPIINDNIILGVDLGLGLAQGGCDLYVTDENSISQDVTRRGSGLAYLLGVDLRKRITNFFFWDVKLGYFNTYFSSLSRGDYVDPGKNLTISAPYLALGLGGNF